MKLVLEFDDFHFLDPESCIRPMLNLINRFPNIKLSLFSIPLLRGYPISQEKSFCDFIKYWADRGNIRLAVHGLLHTTEEFRYKGLNEAIESLKIAENIFYEGEIPFTKVFRGPHWGMNQQVVKALEICEYTHLYNHEQYFNLCSDKMKIVYYTWNLKDSFDSKSQKDLIIGHGHTHNVCGNGMEESMTRIIEMIESYNPDFLFVDEV